MSGERPSTTRSGLHRVAIEARRRSSGELRAYAPPQGPRSGTMPDASGRVICPFCRKLYPYSAALLNRQLRCSGCRGIFTTAADRRTFKITPPPEPVPEAVGTASHAARASLARASSDLSTLAKQALDALSDTAKPHPRPASGSVPDIQSLTARLAKRKTGGPVLSGSGEMRQRSLRTILGATLGACAVAGLIVLAIAVEDPRWTTLQEFQAAPSVSGDPVDRMHALLRRAWTPVAIDAVVGLEHAVLGREERHDLGETLAPLSGLASLVRGRLWADASRLGEAASLIGDLAVETPTGERTALERLAKAGIRTETWAGLQSQIDRAAPPGLAALGTILLSARPVRGERPDPVDLLSSGKIPGAAATVPFEGRGRLLLREGGFREVAYRGRLARFDGDGWPEGWAVLDVRVVDERQNGIP